MNVQMMEGLLGSSSNIKLSGTPMSVYRLASAEGDEETEPSVRLPRKISRRNDL